MCSSSALSSPSLAPPRHLERIALLAAQVLGGASVLAGLLTLTGWALNIRGLTDWDANGISMLPNTAVVAASAGAALWALASGRRKLVPFLASVAAAIGVLTVILDLAGIDLGIDRLVLHRQWGQRATVTPGRMGLPAATSYTLLSAGLLLALGRPQSRRAAVAVALVVFALALLSVTGHLLGVSFLFTIPRLTTIALQTGIVVLALSVGLVAAITDQNPVRMLLAPTAAGMLARRALPVVCILPIVLGWLRAVGEKAGLIDPAFGTAVLVLLLIALLVALTWRAARTLERYENAVHAQARTQQLVDEFSELGARIGAAGSFSAPELMRHVTRRTADTLGAAQCGLSHVDDPAGQLITEYHSDGGSESLSRAVALADCSAQLLEDAATGRTTVRSAAPTAAIEENSVPLRSGSFIHVPLRRDGAWVASFWVASDEPRTWSSVDIELVEDVAERVWLLLELNHIAAELRQSEQRFRLMADAAPVLIWINGTDQRRRWVNKSWLDFVGRPLEAELDERWLENVHREDRHACREAYSAAAQAGRPFQIEYRLRRHDREYRWVLDQGIPLRGPGGEIAGFIGSCVDITERRASEEARARLAAIVETSRDAIISKSLQGIIRTWNAGAEGLFGWTAEEAVGRSIDLIIPPELRHEERDILERLKRGEVVSHYETVRVAKDGRRADISLTISPIRDSAGRITGASKVAREITARKRLEQERERLLESERAARTHAEAAGRLKEEFLATVSHELRTPLNGILGWAQLLQRRPHDPAALAEGLEAIERGARMQAQIINDLLDMNRIVSGKLRLDVQNTDLEQVIEAALDTVRPGADAKGIRIHTSIAPATGPVTGDPTRLQQVVWNLLSNAVKFTPPGGQVQVGLQVVDDHAEITVVDSGIGIPPEFMLHVFERFRQADSSITRQHGGLGLGLAIVKQIVELHGGAVSASSDGLGLGATFRVRLPLTPHRGSDPEPAYRSEVVASDVKLSGVRILVVDDDPDGGELLRRLLVGCEAEVDAVTNGPEALERLDSFDPDLLLCDISMPGMDGFEVIRRVRARQRSLPAVAVTAFARAEDRIRALQAGFNMHLSKPVEARELLTVCKTLIETVPGERARD